MEIKKLFFNTIPFMILGLALVASSCETTQDPEDVSEDIREANDEFMQAFNNGNLEEIRGTYAPTATLYPPSSEPVTGIEDIANYWEFMIDSKIEKIELETISAESVNGRANEIGRYVFYGESGQILDRGKYVAVWDIVGDGWRQRQHIWNTSMPLPVVEEEAPADDVSMNE